MKSKIVPPALQSFYDSFAKTWIVYIWGSHVRNDDMFFSRFVIWKYFKRATNNNLHLFCIFATVRLLYPELIITPNRRECAKLNTRNKRLDRYHLELKNIFRAAYSACRILFEQSSRGTRLLWISWSSLRYLGLHARNDLSNGMRSLDEEDYTGEPGYGDGHRQAPTLRSDAIWVWRLSVKLTVRWINRFFS